MTELETMQRAKMYMEKLAQGIDPTTGEVSALDNPRLVKCFAYVADVLDRVIQNGGMVGDRSNLPPFTITVEEISRIELSSEPVRMTELLDRINRVVNTARMKKLSAGVVSGWLLADGLLEKQQKADGSTSRLPTGRGRQMGLFTEIRQGQAGEYTAVYYDSRAQRYVVDHLPEILAGRTREK